MIKANVFDRIHIIFLDPFKGKTFQVIVDFFSKLPEAYEMGSINSSKIINKLRDCIVLIVRYAVSNTIISDNGTSFEPGEFKNVYEKNAIILLTSLSHHLATKWGN